MGSVKKLVKKVARPKVLLPLLAIGTGGAALGAFGPAAKAAMLGTAGIPATAAMSGIHPAIAAVAPTKGILGGLLGTGGKLSTAGKIGLGAGAVGGLASLFGKDKRKEPERKGNGRRELLPKGNCRQNRRNGGRPHPGPRRLPRRRPRPVPLFGAVLQLHVAGRQTS